jgi:hypothetical protein
VRQVLFGPDFNMGCIDLESDEDRESMELSPEREQEATVEGGCSSALPSASQISDEPLSHYVSDDG